MHLFINYLLFIPILLLLYSRKPELHIAQIEQVLVFSISINTCNKVVLLVLFNLVLSLSSLYVATKLL